MTTLTVLNAFGREEFVARVGFAFESSPWIAAAAWEERPFASVAELHAAMRHVVDRAPRERQLELIRAHPDLDGNTAAAGKLTPASREEQASAGLHRLPADVYARLARAIAAYRERFGYPFVVCVREHTVATIVADAERRLANDHDRERRIALDEIAKIAALRLHEAVADPENPAIEPLHDEAVGAMPGIAYDITYGKAGVPVYRQYARPLTGVPRVPESPFVGRDNALFANEVSIEVFGENFLPAYTKGDNSNVIATDSMKNFILHRGREYEGATLEGYLDYLGGGFLTRYPQAQGILMSGRELPFSVVEVPRADGGLEPSAVLRQRRSSDYSTAELRYVRDRDAWTIAEHRCGRVNMELLKTKGSAFTNFVRDEYTTLPERIDRPLFVHLDVHWRYADAGDALGNDPSRYVAGEQVRDVCAVVFDEFVSKSIQELVHEMGKRLLERYPQLCSVEFIAKNMTRDPYAVSEDPDDDRKVFVPPFPAFGTISLSMTRAAQ